MTDGYEVPDRSDKELRELIARPLLLHHPQPMPNGCIKHQAMNYIPESNIMRVILELEGAIDDYYLDKIKALIK